MTLSALSTLDVVVLDAADCRTIDGIVYVIGSHRRNATKQSVSKSLARLRKAGLVQIVDGTYPVEFQRTGDGERALAASV